MSQEHSCDVLIIGGGAAGLAAAVVLGRSRRSVTVVDLGQPRNAASSAAHNVLGQEGISPLDLQARGRAEAESYGVELVRDRVVSIARADGLFRAETEAGKQLTARRVILAQGASDSLPDVPGLAEHWGTAVLHCPFCHGWEARDSRILVLGTSPMSGHQALMFAQLSDQVQLLIHEAAAEPSAETAAMLERAGVNVVQGRAGAVESDGDGLNVLVEDGAPISCDHIVVASTVEVDDTLWTQLGGEVERNIMGTFIPSEERGRTAIDGVWVAGNAGNLSAMVVSSMHEGVMAGADLNFDLILEDRS